MKTTLKRLTQLLSDYDVPQAENQADEILIGTDYFFSDGWVAKPKELNTKLAKATVKEWNLFYDFLATPNKIKSVRIITPRKTFEFSGDTLAEFIVMFHEYNEKHGDKHPEWKSHYRETRASAGISKLRSYISNQKLLGPKATNRKINILTYKVLSILEVVPKIKYPTGKAENKMNSFILKHL